jgi:thiol:disulfide interchange protein DsbA
MPLTRRRFHQLILGALGASLLPNASRADLVQGRDWRPISPPQPSGVPGKIEVLEFFAYGCPHCADLNPLIDAWAKGLPADVAFRREPVSFGRAAWANLARLYFALDLLGELPRLDQAVFEALHRGRASLYTEPAIRAWVAEKGIDAKAFQAASESFDVDVRLKRSDLLVREYAVESVPMIAVGGRYAVTGTGVKALLDLLRIADDLIALARTQTDGASANPVAAPQGGS